MIGIVIAKLSMENQCKMKRIKRFQACVDLDNYPYSSNDEC